MLCNLLVVFLHVLVLVVVLCLVRCSWISEVHHFGEIFAVLCRSKELIKFCLCGFQCILAIWVLSRLVE